MSMFESILREKHLRRTQQLQELAAVRMRCEASGQVLATAQRLHDEAGALLWQTMTASELCVQRLAIARTQESSVQRSVDDAASLHTANRAQLECLQRVLARIEKDIEKLQERWELRTNAAASERLKREWRELDDWMLGRRGEMG